MARSAKVEIDDLGHIRPLDTSEKLPPGRAILTWPETSAHETYLLSEHSLSDWLTPEEDEAWAYLQPDK